MIMAEDRQTKSVHTQAGDLPPAAQRALVEAEERRRKADAEASAGTRKEINGPKGPEPTRYGDWERKGIATDF